jgi:hypothetical protein
MRLAQAGLAGAASAALGAGLVQVRHSQLGACVPMHQAPAHARKQAR